MTDPGYIFSAAKLAEGWNVYGQLIVPPWKQEKGPVMHVYNPSTILVDAMAAQLVRQVDALGTHHFGCHDDICSLSEWVYPDHNMRALKVVSERKFKGTDRAMNTIKVIVDSNILK